MTGVRKIMRREKQRLRREYDDWLWDDQNNDEGITIRPGTHLRCKTTGRYYVVTDDHKTVCITTGAYGKYPSVMYYERVEN